MKIGEIGGSECFALPKIGNSSVNKKGILIDDINEIIFVGGRDWSDPTVNAVIEIPYSFRNCMNFDSKEITELKDNWDKKWVEKTKKWFNEMKDHP